MSFFCICILAAVDPCNPNPCGAAAACSVQDGVGVCHCPPGVKEEECHIGESLKLSLIRIKSAKISYRFNVIFSFNLMWDFLLCASLSQ